MSVSSNPVSPIRPIGSNVTLTCTVELQSPAVDVPVTVNVQMSDPAGSPLTTTPLSVSGSTYTTTSMISSFSREQSGLYTCRASISSTFSSLSDSRPQYAVTKVTVGETVYDRTFTDFTCWYCSIGSVYHWGCFHVKLLKYDMQFGGV